jgi:hypothetical protein
MIRSRWTLDHYRDLLSSLLDRGLTPLELADYAERRPGVWLRHDVELSLGAALTMARVENEFGIPSSYFVCVESPFFTSDDAVLTAVDELRRLHRDVSFHFVLSPDKPTVGDRLGDVATRFPSLEPRALTFHAPGVAVAELADQPLGEIVYRPMVNDVGRYFSDSTGRWRWGRPDQARLEPTELVQVLTHPFWWAGGDQPAELDNARATTFLPQLTSMEDQHATGRLHRISVRSKVTHSNESGV